MHRALPGLSSGIYDRAQYLAKGEDRRYAGPRVAYTLLRVGEVPTADEIRVFEDICFTLRLANGTFRTTFRDRFADVDELSIRLMRESFQSDEPIRIEDRAVSSALTSCQWAKRVFEVFPNAEFEASDLLIELLEVSSAGGETFVTEPGGAPLQYIRPPFVVALNHPESWRNPVLRFVAFLGRRRFRHRSAQCTVRPISCIHPEAQVLARTNPNFRVRVRSVFERTQAGCHVVRTMNILNRAYFSPDQLREAVAAVHASLQPNGIWIVGRTTEDDFANHATFFRRLGDGWQVVERTGGGSEIEDLAIANRSAA